MKQSFAVINLFISLIILISSCGRGGENTENQKPAIPGVIIPKTPLDATVKVYFENTLSMDGYINGNTEFKNVFRELLVAVENENEIDFTTQFYLINDKLTPTDFGVQTTKISEKLTPKNTAGKGNKGSSDFEEILDKILENQTGDAISVIMADFIYSPEGEKDTPSALNKLKTYTQNAFRKAGKDADDLETRIYRFTSDFNGVYYDINNKHITGIENRPYYYFVIAPSNLMPIFSNKIAPQLKNNSGYKNEALFTAKEFNSIPTQVLTSTANNGRIRSRNDDLEIIKNPKKGNLEFTVLANLTELPVDDKYLLDKKNYKLANPEFSIKDIGLVKGKNIDFSEQGAIKIDPSTLVKIKDKNFTHAILFSTEEFVSEDLEFALRKRIPSWVEEVNSNDDQRIKSDSLEQTRTFSFAHLVNGISKAYELQSGNDEYFKIIIPIK